MHCIRTYLINGSTNLRRVYLLLADEVEEGNLDGRLLTERSTQGEQSQQWRTMAAHAGRHTQQQWLTDSN